jgi:hypothetical protein
MLPLLTKVTLLLFKGIATNMALLQTNFLVVYTQAVKIKDNNLYANDIYSAVSNYNLYYCLVKKKNSVHLITLTA